MYYASIVDNATRCRTHVVPFPQLATDLAAEIGSRHRRLIEHDHSCARGKPRIVSMADTHAGDIGDQVSAAHR